MSLWDVVQPPPPLMITERAVEGWLELWHENEDCSINCKSTGDLEQNTNVPSSQIALVFLLCLLQYLMRVKLMAPN